MQALTVFKYVNAPESARPSLPPPVRWDDNNRSKIFTYKFFRKKDIHRRRRRNQTNSSSSSTHRISHKMGNQQRLLIRRRTPDPSDTGLNYLKSPAKELVENYDIMWITTPGKAAGSTSSWWTWVPLFLLSSLHHHHIIGDETCRGIFICDIMIVHTFFQVLTTGASSTLDRLFHTL